MREEAKELVAGATGQGVTAESRLQFPAFEEVKREPELVYGTYDEATHCITIVCPDDEMQIEESVQEISSSEQRMNVKDSFSNLDSMSPLSAKSEDSETSVSKYEGMSHYSDCGYESYGSPEDENFEMFAEPCLDGSTRQCPTQTFVEHWPESFSELFPSLV